MADVSIANLPAFVGTTPNPGNLLCTVDVSDTSESPLGTTKRIPWSLVGVPGGNITGTPLVIANWPLPATSRGFEIQTNGATRWLLQAVGAEGGGNTGSPLRLSAYSDVPGLIDDVMVINRAAGSPITFNRPATFAAGLTVTGGVTASAVITGQYVTAAGSRNITLGDKPNALRVTNIDANTVGILTETNAFGFLQTGGVILSGGITSAGGAIYTGGEIGFVNTASTTNNGVYTLGTGSPTMYFDHRATSNTGMWLWRNGTLANNTQMTLSAVGTLTVPGNVIAGGSITSGGNVTVTGNITAGTFSAGPSNAAAFNLSNAAGHNAPFIGNFLGWQGSGSADDVVFAAFGTLKFYPGNTSNVSFTITSTLITSAVDFTAPRMTVQAASGLSLHFWGNPTATTNEKFWAWGMVASSNEMRLLAYDDSQAGSIAAIRFGRSGASTAFIGFYGVTPVARQNISGAGSVAQVMGVLVNLGLMTNI